MVMIIIITITTTVQLSITPLCLQAKTPTWTSERQRWRQRRSSSRRWATPNTLRSRSCRRWARRRSSNSSSKTGGTKIRRWAWAWLTSPTASPRSRRCLSTPPPCTSPPPWPPSTVWWTTAVERNRWEDWDRTFALSVQIRAAGPSVGPFGKFFLCQIMTEWLLLENVYNALQYWILCNVICRKWDETFETTILPEPHRDLYLSLFLDRSGVSRGPTRRPWIRPHTDSSTVETVTSSFTTTVTEDVRDTSSTCGENTSGTSFTCMSDASISTVQVYLSITFATSRFQMESSTLQIQSSEAKHIIVSWHTDGVVQSLKYLLRVLTSMMVSSCSRFSLDVYSLRITLRVFLIIRPAYKQLN